MELRSKDVLVVGLARSGVAAAAFCHRQGARVTVADRRNEADLSEALEQLRGVPLTLELGEHRPEVFTQRDLIVLSPGVPRRLPALQAASEAGVPVWSELELASRHLEAPMVAVTGTNGKTTTVSLLGDVLRRAGRRVFVGGNIGEPLLHAVGGGAEVLVVEVSSFQLESTHTLAPDVAVLLNITPDHLDRYDSIDDYAAAKERLFANQGAAQHAVLNAEDPRAVAIAERAPGRSWFFSSRNELPVGSFLDGEDIVLRLDGPPERFRAAGRRLIGHHNLENLLVMALCARLTGVPAEAIQATIDNFPGLAHRLELVRTRAGVRFYNDSKATNVEAAQRSLESVGGGIRLIAGGVHKLAPYAPLGPLVQQKVRTLYTIGESAPLLEAELGHLTEVTPCGDLATAVERAADDARPGEAVLLSPACASFDQFANYEARGARFRELVEALP